MKRTVAILPNRFWDKTAYALGRTGSRTGQEHAAFKALHRALLAGTDDPGLVAFLRLVETWNPADLDRFPHALAALDANVVFRWRTHQGVRHAIGAPETDNWPVARDFLGYAITVEREGLPEGVEVIER